MISEESATVRSLSLFDFLSFERLCYWTSLKDKQLVLSVTRHRPPGIYFSDFLYLGSNHVWDFEEDAYNSTRCTIHTFDCTVQSNSMPEYIRDRATFHKICMGSSENSSEGKIFMNLKEVMDMLGHSYVTLLKVRRK